MNNSSTEAFSLEILLKRYWQIPELRFIGRYVADPDGKKAKFADLRSMSGDALFFPPNNEAIGLKTGRAFAFVFANPKLAEGEYYQFNAQINQNEREIKRNPLFAPPQPFGKVSNLVQKRMEKEEFIKKIFRQTGASPKDAKDLARSLKNFQLELYTRTERFIFEILQNADDFPVDNRPVQVNFAALDENILIQHNGRSFDERDVRSICSIGDSAKSQTASATGYKGIGFKSVFTQSKRVFISSGGYTFCFDKEYSVYSDFGKMYPRAESEFLAEQQTYIGSDNVPWQIKPIWREKYLFPREVRTREDFFRENVSFCLEFGETNSKDFKNKALKFFGEPRFLLFLKNINRISYTEGEGANRLFVERSVDGDMITLLGNQNPKTYIIYQTPQVDFSDHSSELIAIGNVPKKLIDYPYLNLTFAGLLEDGNIVPEPDTVLFTYLPTEDKTYGFPFLVNADFVMTANREQIPPDNKWNELVFKEIGYNVFVWIKHIIETNPERVASAYRLIPEPPAQDTLVCQAFQEGFDKAIREIPFILNQSGTLQCLDDTLIDKAGLSQLLQDDFASITGQSKQPISDKAETRPIERLCTTTGLGQVFGREELLSLTDESTFQDWLKHPTNNANFLQLLHEKRWLAGFKDQAIFLNQHNELQTANGLWLDLGDDQPLLDWMPVAYLHPEVRQQTSQFKVPVESYNPIEFIAEAILQNKQAVNDLLGQKANNLSFYRYLFKHRNKLTTDHLSKDKLFWFKVWGKQDDEEHIISFQNDLSLYAHHSKLNRLLESQAFPKGHFCLLSSEFAETPNQQPEWDKFWQRFNVNLYSAASFLKDEILDQISKLNAHFGKYTAFDDEASEEYLQLQQGSISVWQSINDSLPTISANELKSTQRKLSTLVVFTANEGQPKPLKDCYLPESYTGSDAIKQLVKEYSLTDIHFVSDVYQDQTGVNWRKLFGDCGVDTDTSDAVRKHVLPSLKNLSDAQKIVSFTGLIISEYTNLKADSAAIAELINHLKCKTAEGNLVPMRDALLGSYYEENTLINSILPSVELPNQISDEYATSGSGKAKWVEFFKALGAIVPTEQDIISRKIDQLLANQSTYNTPETTVSLVGELLILHQQEKLTEVHLKKLAELWLLVSSDEGTMLAVSRCHLPSVLKPALDLEQLLPQEVRPKIFVTPDYIVRQEDQLELKDFLITIGVQTDLRFIYKGSVGRDELPDEYRKYADTTHNYIPDNAKLYASQHSISPWSLINYQSYLSSPQIAAYFWDKVLSTKWPLVKHLANVTYSCRYNNYTFKNYIAFTLQTARVIPNLAGEYVTASALYSIQHKDLIDDPALTPAIDLSSIEVENKVLEEWLGIRQSVPLRYYLRRISQVHDLYSLKEAGIWDKVADILKKPSPVLEEADKTDLDDFKANGTLPNQLGDWRPVKDLYVIIDGFKLGIGKWKQLIHKDLVKLAEKLGVTTLTEADFEFASEKPHQDWKLRYEIIKRLKFIAFAEDNTRWQNLEQEYRQRINSFTFYQTDEILFVCKKVADLKSTERDFYENGTEIYYLGSWNEPRAGKLIEFLYRKLSLEKTSQKQFNDFLFGTEKKIIDLFDQRNLPVPEEWRPKSPVVNQPVQLTTSQTSVGISQPGDNPVGSSEQEDESESEQTVTPIDTLAKKAAISVGLSPEEQKQRNQEAKNVLLNWLNAHPEYDCSDAESDDYQIANVRGRATGKTLTFFISSVVKGTLYVWPARWLEFGKPNTRWALVINDHVEILSDQQELLDRYSRTLLRVHNNAAPVLEDLTAVAEQTQYSQTWQFMFYDPTDEYYSTPRTRRPQSDTGPVDVTPAEDDILD
ncbi:hypothetical protein F5984_23930 [Rudanella paleaurantiibacter]|uniref:Sacsin/Nov domain-containing protein n=1 Tax=Rudanella paleaurantiibacter TaxID=2614655 RepID=A0A7J5TTK1_9BACT|nr:hypothetical protein [Rudanella paleaurantiibacter]KAB7726681.1 hypothetical protein F5984_23930 [Rudanella paleaurantiibacter]